MGQNNLPDTVVDNDIVEKLCRWNSVDGLSECLETEACSIGYLGSLRFVVGKKLNRIGLSAASEQFDQFLQAAKEIDLSESELELAASILEFSDHSGLEFDAGESILFSVGILRHLQSVATGDKRAICCCKAIAEEFPVVEQLKRKFRAILKLRLAFFPSPAMGCGGSGPFFRLQDVSMHSSPYCDIFPCIDDY